VSDASKAVFLSYASQDAEAARRICEALRAAGVEVWFDQSEPLDPIGAHGLVGGDAWDAKIRKQIKECALFVPLISASTQARLEGYFRLEWLLAVERSRLMAAEKAFLLPVVIDATPDAAAKVPDKFREMQWTRIRPAMRDHGGPARDDAGVAAFCARVCALLDGGSVAEETDVPSGLVREKRLPPPKTRLRKPSGSRWGLVAVVAVMVLGALALWRPWRSPAAPASVAAATEKTLAVMPFTTRGDRNDEDLADGIADELLTQLGRTPGLRVSGRTSSFSFKGRNLTDAEIARQLQVEYLVAGTFETNGSQVRVRPQLINARNGSILWGETFTKELTNVFALQDEISGLIAQKLQLQLGSAARAMRTVNPVAYGLVQKGRYLWLQRRDDALAEAIASYEEAIRVDPRYAEAHAGLADALTVRGWYFGLEGTNRGAALFVQARAAAREALRIDPTLAEPHAALGAINLNEERFAEAEAEFQAALQLNPNYSYAHHWRAHLHTAQGRIDEGIAGMARATQIDPFSLSTLVIHAQMLAQAGRHAEAVMMTDRALAVRQGVFIPADGVRALSLLLSGRKDEALAAARVVTKDVTVKPRWWVDAGVIHVLRQTGHDAEARQHAERLLAVAAPDSYAHGYVALVLGRSDEALDILTKVGATPTMRSVMYYSEVLEDVRRLPRFPEVLKSRGWWDDYERGRATLARMARETGGSRR
jgi:TolB-like protein/tetratricopeptide (TPR) repeat protein